MKRAVWTVLSAAVLVLYPQAIRLEAFDANEKFQDGLEGFSRPIVKEASLLARKEANGPKSDKKEKLPVVDFSGEPGWSSGGGWKADDGGDGKDIVLILKSNPDMKALDLTAYEVGNPSKKKPAKRVEHQFPLPLPEKVKVTTKGGSGASGRDAQCRNSDPYGRCICDRPGDGGNGGDGGNMTVYYSHPELLSMVEIDAGGGSEGFPGNSWGCPGTGWPGREGKPGKVEFIQGEPPRNP